MNKKLISVALTATTFAWAVGVAFLPVAANAQTTTDLQSQIAALLAQIQTLQGQLNSTSGTTTTSGTASYSFTKDLTLGSKGADVTALQTLLINAGDLKVSATGYFGALTKAALMKYQAAKGISPAAGYFGPKTRAFVNSMSVSTTTTTTTTNTTNTTTNTNTTVVAPATGMAVSVASDNPGAGSLISSASGGAGAARIPVLSVNFTAGNAGAATVSEVKFHKVGVLSDSSIAGAYLTQNGKVLYQYNSLNQGVLDFSGMNLVIPAGQTAELTLAIDVSGGLSAGNTTGFSVNAATDVSAWTGSNTAVTPTGMFPLNGSTFTVTNVSNPSLATMTIAASSIGTTVTAGTQGNLVGAWSVTVQNSKVWLKGINFRVIGSANKGDLRNVKLMVNGTQVGATLATVSQDGTAYFDASAAPGVMNTGSNNVQLFADVMGSPSYNFQFEILNSYDVLAIDSQYNSPITGGSSAGTQVTIQQGQITVTQDANTPTGNVAKGQSAITLAKFDIYAAGEAVKVKFLPFQLTFTGVTTSSVVTSLSNLVQNISLVDDAGGQVGTTINTPPSANVNTGATAANGNIVTGGALAAGTNTYNDSFGTQSSPINYIVPANTTRVLSLKADIQSGALFSTVTGALLTPNAQNLQGLISSALSTGSGATGSALSLATNALAVSANNALGTQTISAGVTSQKIGSYSLTASSAEGVTLNNLSVTMGASSTAFQNLKVMVGSTQFGTTQGTVNANGIYTFSGTPFSVTAGNTVNVDVYADTLSSAATGTVATATSLSGLSGTGMISYSAISLASTVPGQSVTFAGASTIVAGADSTQVSSGQIVMGSTGNSLATYRLTETANVENVKITDLVVTDLAQVATNTIPKAAFSDLAFWNGSTLLGTAGSAVTVSQTSTVGSGTSTYTYSFHFGTPVIVPQANSISLVLKGAAASYASAGATDNSLHTFSIATTTAVTALGSTSNKPATVSSVATAAGNPQTVLRSVLSVTVAPLGSTSGRSKGNPDDFGTITVSANNAGSVALTSLKVTFSGSAASSTLGTSLIDANGQDVVTAGEATSSTTAGASTTWTFAGNGFQISAGGSYTFKLRLNTINVPGSNGISESLSANIQAKDDLTYSDALDALAVPNLTLTSSVVPLTVNSVTYAQGN